MKKLILLSIAFMALQLSYGQLSGIKTIPGDYATIEAAVAALNAQGVGAGGVTFNVAALHTETITEPISVTVTGTSANPIIFQKSGAGVNPLITAYTGTNTPASAVQDGIWNLVGSDYVTIDGIDLYDPNSTNPSTMEYGYAMFKADAGNGCQNNTIRNCTVTLSRENFAAGSGPSFEGSKAINVTNATVAAQTTALTPNGAEGTNSFNKFYNNTLQNCQYGIVLSGYAAGTPFTLGDTDNDIGGPSAPTGNTIINFGGGTGATQPTAGIRATNQWGVNISYNTINNNDGSGVNHVNVIRGIYGQSGTSANADINHNTITLHGGGTTSLVYFIENAIGSTAAGNTVNINNNVLTGDYLTATSGAFYGIWNSASAANVNISGNSVTNLNYSASDLTGSGTRYQIYNSGAAGAVTINGNTVNNIARIGTSGGTTIGIYVSSGSNQTVTNNTISNMSIDGTGTTSTMYGIQTSTGTIVVENNVIHSLSCIKTTGSSALYGIYNISSPNNENYNNNLVYNLTHNGTGTVYGIYAYTTTGVRTMSYNTVHSLVTGGTTIVGINNTSSSPSIFNNKVYNIQSNSTGAPTVSGLMLGTLGTAGVANIYNNLIGDLKAPGANTSAPTAPSVRGINITTTTTSSSINVSYNTIYINASSSGTNFSTAGIFATTSTTATTAALSLRNNIIINKSDPSGTGFTVAYQRSSTALNNYADVSGNNLFFAGVPGATRLIFFDGTNSMQTLADYKALVIPRDALSITEDANFISLSGASADFLHIDELIATQIESGGVPIAGITDDFDGDARHATMPDIGADEFDGILLDLTPPAITYTPLLNTSLTGARTLFSTITDASGVPTAGIGLPRLYWKINAGAYTAVAAVWDGGDSYSFTFGAGVTTGDIVSYYIVAQDMYSPPNVGAAPSAGAGGFTYDPPAASIPPTTPSSYTITTTPLSGTYTVGLTMFNSLGGRNITYEKSVRKVLKEVYVEVPVDKNEMTDATETSFMPKSEKQLMEVEEIIWIPMENGQPYSGELFVAANEFEGSGNRDVTGVYPTITAAIADLNLRGVSGPVTFLLTDATYPTETFPLIVNVNNESKPNANNTVTIRPDNGVIASVTGAAASTQIFKVLEDYIIIDGSNSGGTDRSLTIENTSATSPQVIVIGSLGTTPRTNVTVKNCNIINGVTSSSALIISDGNAPATIGYFNNITIQNNTIQKAYIGVYCIAMVTEGNGSGLLLTQNDLSASGANMIRLVALYVQGVDGATVSDNIIGNMVNTTDASNLTGVWFATGTVNCSISGNTINAISGSSAGPRAIAVSTANAASNISITGNMLTNLTTAASTPPYGIYVFSTTGNITITGNQISGLLNSNTGGYGARGINLLTTLPSSNILVANNIISDIVCTGDASTTYWGVGIAVDGAMGGVNVYHNSVNLFGSYLGYSSGTITAAFYNSSTSTALDVRNNIFVNSFDNTNSATDKAYAINSQAANTAFTDIDYNDYFVSGPTGILGYLGADRTDLAAWQTATGKDASSINTDPMFTSNTNLLPTNTSIDNFGTYLTSVMTDYNGALRTNPPDIGALEFGTNPAVNTLAASGITCDQALLNASFNANGLTVNTYFDYGYTTSYGNTVPGAPAVVSGTSSTPVTALITGLDPFTTYHFRARGVTSGGVTSYGTDLMFTTNASGAPVAVTQEATAIGATVATLNGLVNANCNTTVVTFEYGLTMSYGSNIAAVPSPLTGGASTAVSADLAGLETNMSYHFRVVAVSDAGTTYGSDMEFTTGAIPPTVITNAASGIDYFSAVLNGTVTANNLLTSVTFEWGLTTGYGNTVGGTPATVTGDVPVSVSAGISGLQHNTLYHFRCVGENSAGTTYGNDMTFTTLCMMPGDAGEITGPTELCQATSGHVYSIEPVAYATGYVWTLPPGGTITAGNNTSSITVSYSGSASSGDVTVYPMNVCGNGATSTLAVTVYVLPVPTITALNPACFNNTSNYVTESGMTGYSWSVSAGGQIVSGAGTNAVTVLWNNTGSQWVSVSYTSPDGCPAATSTMYYLTVSPLPATPTVTGPTSMCMNSGNYTYTTEAGFYGYSWTVFGGGMVVSGQGTNVVQITFPTPGSNTIAVIYTNAAGCSPAAAGYLTVNVLGVPAMPGPVTGTAELCEGAMGVAYSIAAIPNTLTYEWTVPAGAVIASGAGTPSITVNFGTGASSGNIQVYGVNDCGNGPASPPFQVTVYPIPPTPVVTMDENYLLTSSASEGNQWYFEGTAIPGATDQTYQAEEEGTYWTVVTLNGCTSNESNHITVIFVGLDELPGTQVSIYPIPNRGLFTVSISHTGMASYDISVFNNLGVRVYEEHNVQADGRAERVIDLGPAAGGLYMMMIRNEQGSMTRKILIMN